MIPVFLFWFYYQPYPASIFIAIILALDSFDGALARYQKTSSDRGKFLDIFVDRIVHCAIIFALFLHPAQHIKLLGYNLVIIPIAYTLATLKKGEGKPSDWIIQPYPRLNWVSMWPILAFFLLIWFQYDALNYSLWLSNILATIMSVYYFILVQKQWKKIYGKPNRND